MNKNQKVLVALLAGAAAGAIAALLLAPEDGKTTRGKLSGLADELLDALNHKGKQSNAEGETEETTLGI